MNQELEDLNLDGNMADKLLCVFFFTVTVGVVTGILVGPVKLANEDQYITYQFGPSKWNTTLDCPVHLQGAEELWKVSWEFASTFNEGKGSYVWENGRGGTAKGRLDGAVLVNRNDGSLELIQLQYDLAGFYSCSATTVDETTAETAKWELLVVDTTANIHEEGLTPLDEYCKFKSFYKVCAIYPEPTVHSGLYSDTYGGFVEEVTAVDWYKQEYDNKSYAYSHNDVVFEVDADTPLDVYFLNSVGITKRDGSYIPLFSSRVVMHKFEERGCPVLKARAYEKVVYNSDRKTCRGEIVPSSFGPLSANVACTEGYKAYNDPKTINLTCKTETWEWTTTKRRSLNCMVDSAFTESASLAMVLGSLSLLRLLQH